jgi:hypothetical protein
MKKSDRSETPVITVRVGRFIRTLVIVCFSAELLFVLLDATINHGQWTDYGMIRRLCNIAREDSLSSWFGTTQTLLVALTLWLIYIVARRDGLKKSVTTGWLVLACFFSYMAVDDGAEIHERIGSAFKQANTAEEVQAGAEGLGARLLEFFPSYSWQIVFMPLFGAMGLFMLLFLWKQLKPQSARIVLIVALSLLSVGVMMDFVEGLDEDHRWNTYSWIARHVDLEEFTYAQFEQRPYDALRHFSKSGEEFLEMLAGTLLWGLFLSHLVLVAGEFKLRFIDLPPARPEL